MQNQLNFSNDNETTLEKIYNMLSTRPLSINEICEASGFGVVATQEALTELELTGRASMNYSGKYTKSLI